MYDYMFNIMLETQTDSHLAGINNHFKMYLENGDRLKVSWATIISQDKNIIQYSIPKSFEKTDEYKMWARSELKRVPFVSLNIFLN